MGESQFSLAGDFPPMDRSQWEGLAREALKGAPLDKLVKQVGGLAVEALYTGADVAEPGPGVPGASPFVRGFRAGRTPWDIRQVYRHPDLAVVNRAVLADLARGVTSVELRLDRSARTGQDVATAPIAGDGVAVQRVADLARALEGVFDDLAPVSLDAGAAGAPAAAIVLALARSRGRDPRTYRTQLNLDPVGAWAGEDPGGPTLETGLGLLADVASFVRREWPNVRTSRVDASLYHDAGATEADELACALATGVAYLEVLLKAGLSVALAAPQIVLRVALDADLFAGIAKLRALRMTWGRVLEAAGAPPSGVRIEATTSRAMMTRRDPWVNMLRTTVACFAGGAGGADGIHIRPFDEAIGLPDDFSLRIARNTQSILQDESHLDQVIDPAGGAWYVESLTRAMAEAAWAQFQAIQREGGIAAALRSGMVQDRIDATWAERARNIARRKTPITGVSEFPHLDETVVPDRQPDLDGLLSAARTRLATTPPPANVAWPSSASGEGMAHAIRAAESGATISQLMAAWTAGAVEPPGPPMRPLVLRARAAGFEALRDASDGMLEAIGRRPAVLLAKLGPVAEHTARATFAKNFFEAGGIEAVDGQPVDEGIEALLAGRPDAQMAVICGSDERYAERAADVARALKTKGLRVYLAGRPQDREQAYRDAGVDEFVFIGCDVLDALVRANATAAVTADIQRGDFDEHSA